MNPKPHDGPAPPSATSGSRGAPPRAPAGGAAASGKKQHVAVPYTAEEERRIQQQLNRVLGPEYVSFRPGGGGQNVSYIEGWKALNLANEIFGFNGWSSELISVQVDFMDSHGGGRVSLGLSVVVRITVRDGTFHEDFGYGFIENAKTKAVAFEKCKKEAFTDGLKRCLRCFGNVLGNCLYDRSIVAKMQKVKLPVPELDSDDFHRDPLVVKRERERQARATAAPAATSAPAPAPEAPAGAVPAARPADATPTAAPTAPSSSAASAVPPAQPPASAPPAPREKENALTPSLVKDYGLDDFDESFVFSDDLPADDADKLDDFELELAKNTDAGKPTPSQVFFTSSKKALDVQQATDHNGIPVYDHKFVSNAVKRTVDPSKSARIRRQDVPTPYTPSEINAGRAAPGVANGIGKRPLGMPPRPPSKRLHPETDPE